MASGLDMGDYDYSDLDVRPIEDARLADVPLLKIMYTDEFRELVGRLNALIAAEEHSSRALAITQGVIAQVPSNYTAWQYRYRILADIASHAHLAEELAWCSATARANEKNYQIWHYRELIIELVVDKYLHDRQKYDLNSEFDIVDEMLEKDEKNYHVWTHRRWLVRYFGRKGHPDEVEFTTALINRDVRNNSAWSHRLFVLSNESFNTEAQFVISQIEKSPTNPSSWTYLRGLCAKCNVPLADLPTLIPALSKYQRGQSAPGVGLWVEISKQKKDWDTARELLNTLSTVLDPLRARFWAYQLETIGTS